MPGLRGGGAERTLINLLQKIDYSRYEVDLIVISKKGPYIHQVPTEVNVTYLLKIDFLARALGYLHRTFNFKWFFKRKMSEIEKEYDVGISFLDSNYTDLLFYTDKFKRRVAFVHSSYLTHENHERYYRHENYRNRLKRFRYSRLDEICFVSNDSMEEFKEVFGEYSNMSVIHNIVDRNAVKKKANERSDRPEPVRFSFSAVGSLVPVKGFDRLLRSAGIVRDKGYDFELHIVGAGGEEQNLMELTQELNLESRVIFHGFVSNPYPVMKNSDVFIMSSVSEALPTVLCEAMILGVPSLVTNCSGCRGLVDRGEYGLMAQQDDYDLAEKMIRYLEDPKLLEHYHKKSLERSLLFEDQRILQKYYTVFDGEDYVHA